MRAQVRPRTPEWDLLVAVLQDACDRIAGRNPEGLKPIRAARARREARRWIKEHAPLRTMSFSWVCEALGLSTDDVRRAALSGKSLRLRAKESA